jgi:hypothetical protein
MTPKRLPAVAVLLAFSLAPVPLRPQGPPQQTTTGDSAPAPAEPPGAPHGTMLLTIFLRHDESRTLDAINAHLKQTGFDKNFPPPGVEVVSWYVMMGIGQVVTLRFPAEKLREVNLVVEHGAWGGAYHTEFYPTYDYKPIWEAAHRSGK